VLALIAHDCNSKRSRKAGCLCCVEVWELIRDEGALRKVQMKESPRVLVVVESKKKELHMFECKSKVNNVKAKV
jgi:hypothetical protein